MDGCLGDFNKAAFRVHNRIYEEPKNWNYFEDWGLTANQFWQPIHELGPDFYGELVEPYPWLDQILDLVKSADEFVIVTTPSKSPWCYYAKRAWVDKYIGEDVVVEVVTKKHLLSKPGHLLIDDCDLNVWKFRDEMMAGDAVTFPAPWNECHVLMHNRMGYIEEELADWSANIT